MTHGCDERDRPYVPGSLIARGHAPVAMTQTLVYAGFAHRGDVRERSVAGERGVAGAVFEEAGDAAAGVVGVEHLDEGVALERKTVGQ